MKEIISYFAACSDGVHEVVFVRRKWWKIVPSGEIRLISEKRIYPTRESAEQAIIARENAKNVKEKRLKEEYEKEEKRRAQLFEENQWLLDLDGVAFGFMTADEIEKFIKKHRR